MKLLLPLVAALFLFTDALTPANAQEKEANANVTDIPTLSEAVDIDDMTHPILHLTPDKSEMVKLEKEAASVIVGNPAHISVMLDTPDTLIVVPRAEGASHFTILGKDGSVLMQRHVIVGASKEKYVRIRRSCSPTDSGCQPTSVYFCPDICHEVRGGVQSSSGSSSGFGFSF